MTEPEWGVEAQRWPTPFVRVPFEIAASALVIVDMQRYWTAPDGPMGALLEEHFPDKHAYFHGRLEDTVIPALAAVLQRYRAEGRPVVHVISGSTRADGKDFLPHLQRRIASGGVAAGSFNLLHIGSEWHRVTEALAPRGEELVVNKTTRSAFTSTGIDQLLRNLGVAQLVVGGLATNGCVDLTARDATDRGYETFLLEDGCVTYSKDAHDPVLLTFHAVFGTVLHSQEIVGG